jgi:hypothetical protein
MNDDTGESAADDAPTAWPKGRRESGSVYLVPDAAATTGPSADADPIDADPIDADPIDADPIDHEEGSGEPPRQAGDDWPWVVEWRAAGEPTPWATGLVLAAFSALVVAVAVWVLSAGLADRPIVAVAVNVLVAAGLAPAMWLSRDLPVLRWIAAGALVGIVAGWVSALLLLPVPG